MPSTITSFYTFSAGSKARSSQVNVNFSNYRGDLLPINEDTITASDSTHHLGGPDHRWNKAYVNLIDFKSSTTGAGLILVGDTTNTTGAWKFQINSVTVAEVKADGIPGSSMQNSAMQLFTTTITASGSWSVPAGVSNIMVWLLGGGGGGAANSGDGEREHPRPDLLHERDHGSRRLRLGKRSRRQRSLPFMGMACGYCFRSSIYNLWSRRFRRIGWR